MCMYVTVCTSNWSGAVVLGAHMSRCHQAGRLGSKGQLWLRLRIWARLLEGSTSYMRITRGPPSYSAREGNGMSLLVLPVFVWLLCMCAWDLCGWPCIYVFTYICCVCVHPVCTCWEYIFRLTTGQTWGCEVTAALPPLDFWIWLDGSPSNKSKHRNILDQTSLSDELWLWPILKYCIKCPKYMLQAIKP